MTPHFESPGATPENLPAFHEALKARLTYPLAWDGVPAHLPQWREAASAKARELMLLDDDDVPFAPEIIDEVDRGTYTARRVVFNVTGMSRVLGLLLVPKPQAHQIPRAAGPKGKGPFPAALMLHDHGAKFDIGKEKMIEPWYDPARLESAREWSAKSYGGRFAGDVLASRGYVVLSVDALGWGDRIHNGYESQQALAANLLNLGTSYAAVVAQEDIRASRFLASLPEVDTARVAAIGFSLGSSRAWQVAAFSEAVTAGVSVCSVSTHKGFMVPGNNKLRGQSAYVSLHPFLSRYLDNPDVAGLAAPKPMAFYAGSEDKLFPVESVQEAYDALHALWGAYGAAAALSTRFWPVGHVFNAEMQDAAFGWLERELA